MKTRLSYVAVFLASLLISTAIYAQTISGKVVGVTDGDTITVVQNKTQFEIRLYGVDTPESHQDFGNKANQFTSSLVFGKQVRVTQEDIDRYGRVVGVVYVGSTCANEEIVKNGFAWVYRQYCGKPFCSDWLRYETDARKKGIGLWSQSNPTPPWKFRRAERTGSKAVNNSGNGGKDETGLVYHGNVNSHVFHKPGCSAYNCKNCTEIFKSREDALKAGYRPCGNCKP